jgi:uncharacterized protein YqhQ
MPSYGGQALIEGVLMRGSKFLAVAVRTPSNEIVVQTEKLGGLYTSKIAKIPFLRGLIILWDSLGLGTKYLTISANFQTEEDDKIEGPALYLSLFISLAVAIVLFFLAPAGIGALIEKWLKTSALVGNLIEGLIRLIFVIGYIWGMGRLPDIKRVFSYHGAEHKTINAFEASADLTPENAKNFSVYHPRCGTGFVLILVIFSVILFSLLGPLNLNIWMRLLSRIILLPVLLMISYEYMRFAANHMHDPVLKYLSFLNMKMQKLTTVEPTLDMLEVSISAFKAMYKLEHETSDEA